MLASQATWIDRVEMIYEPEIRYSRRRNALRLKARNKPSLNEAQPKNAANDVHSQPESDKYKCEQ